MVSSRRSNNNYNRKVKKLPKYLDKTKIDNMLEKLFNSGLTTSEVSKKLERQPGAIRSRLQKLGLIE